MSDLNEVERVGELGARGVGREAVEHAPDPFAPVRRAVMGQFGQIVGGTERQDERPLGETDVDRGNEILAASSIRSG